MICSRDCENVNNTPGLESHAATMRRRNNLLKEATNVEETEQLLARETHTPPPPPPPARSRSADDPARIRTLTPPAADVVPSLRLPAAPDEERREAVLSSYPMQKSLTFSCSSGAELSSLRPGRSDPLSAKPSTTATRKELAAASGSLPGDPSIVLSPKRFRWRSEGSGGGGKHALLTTPKNEEIQLDELAFEIRTNEEPGCGATTTTTTTSDDEEESDTRWLMMTSLDNYAQRPPPAAYDDDDDVTRKQTTENNANRQKHRQHHHHQNFPSCCFTRTNSTKSVASLDAAAVDLQLLRRMDGGRTANSREGGGRYLDPVTTETSFVATDVANDVTSAIESNATTAIFGQ